MPRSFLIKKTDRRMDKQCGQDILECRTRQSNEDWENNTIGSTQKEEISRVLPLTPLNKFYFDLVNNSFPDPRILYHSLFSNKVINKDSSKNEIEPFNFYSIGHGLSFQHPHHGFPLEVYSDLPPSYNWYRSLLTLNNSNNNTTSPLPSNLPTYLPEQPQDNDEETIDVEDLEDSPSVRTTQDFVRTSPISLHLPSPGGSSLDRYSSSVKSELEDGSSGGHIGSPRRRTAFQDGVTVGYTYEAFFLSDGRSRKKIVYTPSESKNQRYTCNLCGKDYATSSNLSRHKQTHRSIDSEQAKKCPHCNKVYVSMPALSMHVLTHSLRHVCGECGKAFSRPWLLQGHLRSHTGEKPFGCAHCGKAFADRSNLRAHMQTHSSFKQHKCKRCDKSFALKSYLNKHLESACFREKPGSSENSTESRESCLNDQE